MGSYILVVGKEANAPRPHDCAKQSGRYPLIRLGGTGVKKPAKMVLPTTQVPESLNSASTIAFSGSCHPSISSRITSNLTNIHLRYKWDLKPLLNLRQTNSKIFSTFMFCFFEFH